MTCDATRRALLEGDLHDPALEAHLSTCDACSGVARTLREAEEELRAMVHTYDAALPLPEALSTTPLPASRRVASLGWVALIAAAALATLWVVASSGPSASPTPPPSPEPATTPERAATPPPAPPPAAEDDDDDDDEPSAPLGTGLKLRVDGQTAPVPLSTPEPTGRPRRAMLVSGAVPVGTRIVAEDGTPYFLPAHIDGWPEGTHTIDVLSADGKVTHTATFELRYDARKRVQIIDLDRYLVVPD